MSDYRYATGLRRRTLSRRRLLAGAATSGAVLGVALAGCGGRPNSQPAGGAANAGNGKPQAGGKVSVRMTADPFDWDMSFAGKSFPNDFGQALAYDTLLGFKHGPGVSYTDSTLVPQLAQKWEAPDGITYTFHLQPGVKFASAAPLNGRPLTSADVKWSYEYWSRTGQFKGDKKLPPSQYASYFEGISSVQTPDPATVVVQFSKPFIPFLNYTGSYFNPIVPHDIYDQDGNLQSRIVGTGPWQIDQSSSQKGSRWVWRKNPTYWNTGQPLVDEVDWIIISDQASAQSAFQARQVDILGATGDTIGTTSADQIKKADPSAQFADYLPVGTSLYLNINTKKAPVSDVRVRQAMSLAFDRDEFIKALSGGKGGWALAGAFPDTFSQDEIHQILKYDPAQAKQLLAAAGFANGVAFDYLYPGSAYGQDYISAIQLMQAQLKKVGININLVSQDKNTWTNNRKTYNFVMTGSGKADLVADVDSWLYDFHSGNKSNYSQITDPKLDSLIDQQRTEVDPAKRKDLIRQAIQLLNQQAYSLAVWTGQQTQFWQPSLKGYAPNFNVARYPQVASWVSG